MKPSKEIQDFIKSEESLSLKAYDDGGGVWTIGFGIIEHPDGTKVKKGDVITRDYAEKLFDWQINLKTNEVNKFLPPLNQNQYDALFDFAYNCGAPALHGSTLLKVITANPNDPTELTVSFLKDSDLIKPVLISKEMKTLNVIKYNFLRWSFDNGKFREGLFRRRMREYNLFVKPIST